MKLDATWSLVKREVSFLADPALVSYKGQAGPPSRRSEQSRASTHAALRRTTAWGFVSASLLVARTRGAINLSPRPALLMSRYFRYAAKEQSGRSVSAECCVSSTGPPPPVIPLDLDRQRRVVDDRALAFEVEFRNVAGEATAIGSAGPYTLVVDRPTDGGGRGLGFNGGQLLYLAIGGVHLERSVQGGGNARHPPHNCSGKLSAATSAESLRSLIPSFTTSR